MDRLDVMRLFVRVVETESFTRAARDEGLSQPTVSKQIAGLEARLEAQLLRRTSRGLSVTEAGQAYYEAAVRVIEDIEAAESSVGRGPVQPSRKNPGRFVGWVRPDARSATASGVSYPV